MFLRLRQICLVAAELDPVVAQLAAVFGVDVCYRDPVVAQFGLRNALLPFGNTFVEVVAPVRQGTTAGRYLERRRGDGGYMVILDTDELVRWRLRAAEVGVRIAAELRVGDYAGIQLHPRDTGGALLELNHTQGGEELGGAYGPAGPGWAARRRGVPRLQIAGATVQGQDPPALAARWAEILQCPLLQAGAEQQVALENATLRFVRDTDGRGEGLTGVEVLAADAGAVRRRAAAAGCLAADQHIAIGGVRFTVSSLPSVAANTGTAPTAASVAAAPGSR